MLADNFESFHQGHKLSSLQTGVWYCLWEYSREDIQGGLSGPTRFVWNFSLSEIWNYNPKKSVYYKLRELDGCCWNSSHYRLWFVPIWEGRKHLVLFTDAELRNSSCTASEIAFVVIFQFSPVNVKNFAIWNPTIQCCHHNCSTAFGTHRRILSWFRHSKYLEELLHEKFLLNS